MLGIGNFLIDNFPSGNFPNFTSINFPSLSLPQPSAPEPILTALLGPLAYYSQSAQPCMRRLRRHNITFGMLPPGEMYIWEVATREIFTWKVTLENIPLGIYHKHHKKRSEKYLTIFSSK